ncbi:MAG TPA: hypothetical protein VGF98_14165 [Candidatus Tumulicola sp.]|jgi:hypothetical protein
MMLSVRRFTTVAILALAATVWSAAPAAALITPSKSYAAAYAFDIYTPDVPDLSSLRIDFFNYLVPQKLLPADNPFCVIPVGCRTAVFTYDYSGTVEALTLMYGDGNKALHTDAMQRGTLHAGALLSVPIFDDNANVVPAIRIGRAFWQRAGYVVGPALPAVSVEATPIPAGTDPDALNYAVVFVASSFTSTTDEDMTAWYLIPYFGLRLPKVTLVNYGSQPVNVVASGIVAATTNPQQIATPFSPDNLQALDSLNAEAMPVGVGSSTFQALRPEPPQTLTPSDKANAMIWTAQ